MKVISVLYFPFENALVIRVTRAHGYFSHPYKVKEYSISYQNPIVENFFHWYQVLQRLQEQKMFTSMRARGDG